MQETTDTGIELCDRHYPSPVLAHCIDCGRPLCAKCLVDVPAIGDLCWQCAAHRAGIHHRKGDGRLHAVAAPKPAAETDAEADAADNRWLTDSQISVAAALPPPPPTHGLAERLEKAGVEPGEIVDEAEMDEDLDRLRDTAEVPERPRRWWRAG